jgi:hypothetical protein
MYWLYMNPPDRELSATPSLYLSDQCTKSALPPPSWASQASTSCKRRPLNLIDLFALIYCHRRGSDRQHRRGAGAPEGAPAAKGKKSPQKLGGIQSAETTVVPLRCYYGALANHRAQVEYVARVVLHLRGHLSAGAVWGDLVLRRFNDCAHQLALVLVPCQAAEPTLATIYDPQSTDRWQEPVHQAPYVTAALGDLGAKLWTLAVSHHRLRRSTPHMIIPASAVKFVCSGALINVQSLESVAFSSSWHPGATAWQVRHGKLLDLVIIPKRCSAHRRRGISKGIKGVAPHFSSSSTHALFSSSLVISGLFLNFSVGMDLGSCSFATGLPVRERPRRSQLVLPYPRAIVQDRFGPGW